MFQNSPHYQTACYDKLSNFYLRFGANFIEEVVESLAPLEAELVVLEEE